MYSDWWSRQKASSCSDSESVQVPLKSLECFLCFFLAVREPVEGRGCAVVFGQFSWRCALCPDKVSPHCDSYTPNGRVATSSVSVSKRKQRR